MTIFLTSSHTLGWAGDLNTANGLADELRACLPKPLCCCMVTSFPDNQEITDRMAWEIRECFDRAELPFDHYEVLDRRTQVEAPRMLADANFIILCGGHVPTENKFFHEIKLRQHLKHFEGILLTISAGSMNCATNVYAPPEMDEEAANPHYKYMLKGLGLTKYHILPHFQTLTKMHLDGKSLIRDIIAPQCVKEELDLYCLHDGAYFLITPEHTELRGMTYLLRGGRKRLYCKDGQRIVIKERNRRRARN